MLNLGFFSNDHPALTEEEPGSEVSRRMSQLPSEYHRLTIVDDDGRRAARLLQRPLAAVALGLDVFLEATLLDGEDLCGRVGLGHGRRDGGRIDGGGRHGGVADAGGLGRRRAWKHYEARRERWKFNAGSGLASGRQLGGTGWFLELGRGEQDESEAARLMMGRDMRCALSGSTASALCASPPRQRSG